MNDAIFSQIDFGPLKEFLEEDNVTDVSYSNGGQVWLKTLDKGVYRVDRPEINNALMEKLAFQCSNVMGKTFNMAHPFLDAESAELRLNFVHESIATNGIACVIRKTPAKIRLNKEKLINEQGIDLESITKFLSALTGFDTGMQNVQMQPQSSMTPARTGGYAAGGGGYSSAAAVPKTIHNMTLNELQTEKSNRESTLADKQEALKAVQSGETQGIKAAQEDVKNAKEAYEQALKNDPSSSKYAGIISANNQKIEENQELKMKRRSKS